jgi:hypothetical protein
MQNKAQHTGIGCFAESATMRRVFRRALETYLLSKYEDIWPSADRFFNDENLTRFFKSVIYSGAGAPDQAEPVLKSVPESAKITGFFLGLNKQALQLVLFFLKENHQQTRLTTRLEKFTRLRKKHLH